jgi:hypothetical protein
MAMPKIKISAIVVAAGKEKTSRPEIFFLSGFRRPVILAAVAIFYLPRIFRLLFQSSKATLPAKPIDVNLRLPFTQSLKAIPV